MERFGDGAGSCKWEKVPRFQVAQVDLQLPCISALCLGPLPFTGVTSEDCAVGSPCHFHSVGLSSGSGRLGRLGPTPVSICMYSADTDVSIVSHQYSVRAMENLPQYRFLDGFSLTINTV